MADTIAAPNTTLSQLQSLHGIFAVFKKRGPTSAEVLGRLKKKLLREAGVANTKSRKRKKLLKIGHGGTLDSNSSGVLVIGIGEGTKMLTSLLKGPKKYTAVAELGIATDTLDVKGNVVEEKKYDHITKEALEEKLKEFTGEIMQVPPLYSALKKNGKRMAALMKQGQEVEPKPARPVRVYGLSLQDFSPPLFTLDLESGSGCHVRSLVDDLGKALSSCAHLKELTRIKQEGFSLEDALREDHWTFADIAQVLKPCPVSPEHETNAKKIKLEG
ncbi:pseudouridylate synthase TRUB1-like isoform X2 [Triplophysa rosa]|uniref:tRNA pseudouridine(55) synthase n=1 Tax=Triplophysa rosa TaxID=992332 RepID=A0A9W7TE38_TRIRA|nr:pseudouridylate synthase TRUB1-like isoform X2 [Triplophysa rosa]KAI7796918.1 putative tRNA pseudouridine synthase 1 [Triplophysa rosa]